MNKINVLGSSLVFRNISLEKSHFEGMDLEKTAERYPKRITIVDDEVHLTAPFFIVPKIRQTHKQIETIAIITALAAGAFSMLNAIYLKYPFQDLIVPIVLSALSINSILETALPKESGLHFLEWINNFPFLIKTAPKYGSINLQPLNVKEKQLINIEHLVEHPSNSDGPDETEHYPFTNSGTMSFSGGGVFANLLNTESGSISGQDSTFEDVKSYGKIDLLRSVVQKLFSYGMLNAESTTFLEDVVVAGGIANLNACSLKNLFVSGLDKDNPTKVILAGNTTVAGKIICLNKHVEILASADVKLASDYNGTCSPGNVP